jgi:Triphosphoribosyl-dephospho-CoA synthetase
LISWPTWPSKPSSTKPTCPPKPGLVDRRSSGAHTDMTLALMHASALALWPCLRQMAEAAQAHGEIGRPLRAELGPDRP